MYSELVYFDGAQFAHIVAREEHGRLKRLLSIPESLRVQPLSHYSQAGGISRALRHRVTLP